MKGKTFTYFILTIAYFFFYWALLPKFYEEKTAFFAAGLIFLGLLISQLIDKYE